jgi:hypothetical protein
MSQNLRDHRVESLRVAPDDGHTRTLFSETQRDGVSNARRSSCHDCDFPLQLFPHLDSFAILSTIH